MFAPVPAAPSPPFSHGAASAPPTYTLVCAVGTFTLTGQDATFTYTPASDTTDTHDGFDDEEVRKKLRDEEERFKSKRDQLREVIARAYDPEHGKVAEEVQALASPYVERVESGTPRIDYAALERNKAVMDSVLAFQDALRTEYQARIELENDDEDVMLLTTLWS